MKRLFYLGKNLKAESGSSIIETAMILPIFLTITFGFVNFCLVLFGEANINFASRSALRYATLHSNTSYSPTTQANLNQIVSSFLFAYPSNTYSVTASYPTGNTVGSIVNVNVSIVYSFSVMSHTYGTSYNTTGSGSILQ